ncbi:alpha/beta fold hydrolase [Kitasatospora sp. NPDC057015]|uniref:alpha/beta fold hydrolase n=1 Tax=Kitasatospora sp. NPDC057015 TaxID=3346001 RepID=UPI00363B0770
MGVTGGDFDWDVRRSGPADAEHRVLLLPGALCTAAFYQDVMAQPSLAGVSLVAVTLPGFGRTAAPADLSVENYARLLGDLAAELGCDLVAGHSLGANVAIEMVLSGRFAGPVLLLDPSFSREDESKDLAGLDRLGRIPGLGTPIWAVTLKLLPRSMKGEFHPDRADALLAVMSGNAPGFSRRLIRRYFDYLDGQGSLAARLVGSGARAWVVRGDRTDIGLTADERRALEAGPEIALVVVPDSGHMVITDQPARVAELVLAMLPPTPGP